MFPSLSPDYILSVYISNKMNPDKTIDTLLNQSSKNDSKKDDIKPNIPSNTDKQFEFDMKVKTIFFKNKYQKRLQNWLLYSHQFQLKLLNNI